MNITKKYLAKKVSTEINISSDLSKNFVNSFFNIHRKVTKSQTLKISKFGSYNIHTTPARQGRNPKSMEEYPIPEKKELDLKPPIT